MLSFKQRSYQKELLDGPDIPFGDIKMNMQELEIINQKLGGHHISLQGLNFILNHSSLPEKIHIVETGCGGGDNLMVIKKKFSNKNAGIKLTGIDINPECIAYAKERNAGHDIEFICSDYKEVVFEKKPDIIFSSLFCHHFTDHDLVFMLRWMHRNSDLGFFINDLHRHALAYYSIKWLTRAFSKSYLVKNDAPLSVQKGFTRKEWNNLFDKAGLKLSHCQWKWAFRWLVIYFNNGAENKI